MSLRPRWGPAAAAAVVSLAAAGELAALGALVRDDARRSQQAEIRAEFAVVEQAQALLPMVSTATIVERLSRERGDGAHLLQQPDGRIIAGDLAGLPALRRGRDGFLTGRTPEGRPLVAERRVLEGGFPLLIGRRGRRAADALTLALAVFAALATALIALIDLISRRGEARLLGRVREIDAALEAVRAGDLARRAPERPGAAHVDLLARHINSTLERLEELAQQHRSTGQFIAHELHRPLAAACRELDAVAGEAPALQAARAGLGRLSEAFDALVELSELRGNQPMERRAVRLDMLAGEAVALYAPTAEGRGLTLGAELAAAAVSGAPDELRTLVVNLLDNAVKYTSRGAVRVVTGAGEGCAWLRIKDRGPGLAGFPPTPGRHGARIAWRDREDGDGGTEVEVVFPADDPALRVSAGRPDKSGQASPGTGRWEF